jgi:hypothetical protein
MGKCIKGWIVISILAGLIGLVCLTAGWVVNRNYNSHLYETTCTYTAYNFRPFPWNNWNCKGCTAYYASITTVTADQRSWYTHTATVYPPGNSIDRQTNWYRRYWPIGLTVKCFQANNYTTPIFQLSDVDGTFWAAISFFSISILIASIIAMIVLIQCGCRKPGYDKLQESTS